MRRPEPGGSDRPARGGSRAGPRAARGTAKWSRLVVAALTAAAALSVAWARGCAAFAAASTTSGATVTVSPAKLVARVRAGRYSFDEVLTNSGSAAVRIVLTAASLSQEGDGTAEFRAPGPRRLRLGETSLLLAPGATRRVRVTAVVAPETAGLYAAVLATVLPPRPERSGVTAAVRLASLVELVGPGHEIRSAKVAGVRAVGGRQRDQVDVEASVTDTGNVLISPAATAVIRTGSHLLATVPLGAVRVVPGSSVDVSGAWDAPRRLDSPVDVVVHLVDPPASAAARVVFRHGAAPFAAARIVGLRAVPEPGGVEVALRLDNTGNVRLRADVEVEVWNGRRAVPRASVPTVSLAPGGSQGVRASVRLEPGTWEIVVRAATGDRTLDERQLAVTVPGPGVAWCVLLAVGALAVLLGAAIWWRWSRPPRRRARRTHAARHARTSARTGAEGSRRRASGGR